MNKKILLIILAIVVIAGAVYFYMTRPTKAPSEDIQANAVMLNAENDSNQVVFRIVPAESSAEFNINEVLNGQPKTVVGTTNQVAGDMAINFEDPNQSQVGEIRINARTLKTDDERRNSAISRFILRSEKDENEFITFRPTSVESMPRSVSVGDSFGLRITGDLTVSGVTRETVFNAAVSIVSEDKVTANAETVVMYKDFGLSIPQVPFVANVGDEVTLKINVVAKRI
ncbi:MAG: YceI family protein [Candidatus Paceibacterota bacterium]